MLALLERLRSKAAASGAELYRAESELAFWESGGEGQAIETCRADCEWQLEAWRHQHQQDLAQYSEMRAGLIEAGVTVPE